jgi:acyl dehydratase
MASEKKSGEAGMADFQLAIGDSVHVSKTIGESDVYLFAGITGDFSPNHVNEEVMRSSAYGGRIAHGARMVGFMSTASTAILEKKADAAIPGLTPVTLGYDKVRFLGAVRIGDTITVDYTVTRIDAEARRSYAKIEIFNQRREIVAAAEHIMKWVGSGDLPPAAQGR